MEEKGYATITLLNGHEYDILAEDVSTVLAAFEDPKAMVVKFVTIDGRRISVMRTAFASVDAPGSPKAE